MYVLLAGQENNPQTILEMQYRIAPNFWGTKFSRIGLLQNLRIKDSH